MLLLTLCDISCRFVRWLVLCAPPVQCEFKQNEPSNPEIGHGVPDQWGCGSVAGWLRGPAQPPPVVLY